MTPVYQVGAQCLRACIASILDLGFKDVPNFAWKNKRVNLDWLLDLRRWASGRGFGVVYFEPYTNMPSLYGSWVVAVGKTNRRSKGAKTARNDDHAVVCKSSTRGEVATLEYIHDPAGEPGKDHAFLDSVAYCLVFTVGGVV